MIPMEAETALLPYEANDLLGTEGTYTGVDVAGTINGEAATGAGQILVGDAPPDIIIFNQHRRPYNKSYFDLYRIKG